MQKRSFAGKIAQLFFQGLLIIAPLAITIYVIYISFVFVDGLLNKYIESFIGFSIPGLGLLIILTGITFIGLLGNTILFRPIGNYLERLMVRAPIIKILYTSVKDLLQAFVGSKRKFTEPVLVKINNDSNLSKIGFITQHDLSAIGIEQGNVAVYLPHSYNFSGNLFIVEKANVKPLNVPATEVMKFVVSAGITEIESK